MWTFFTVNTIHGWLKAQVENGGYRVISGTESRVLSYKQIFTLAEWGAPTLALFKGNLDIYTGEGSTSFYN